MKHMMKKMNILSDTLGSAYIYAVVIVLIASMLLSCLFLLFSARTALRGIREESKERLDAYVGAILPDLYRDMKEGTGFASRLDTDALVPEALCALGFDSFDETRTERRGMVLTETRIESIEPDGSEGSGLSFRVFVSCRVSMLIFSRKISVGTDRFEISSRYVLKGE